MFPSYLQEQGLKLKKGLKQAVKYINYFGDSLLIFNFPFIFSFVLTNHYIKIVLLAKKNLL